MNQNSNRSMLLGVVGGYLVYLAYDLLKDLINHGETSMPMWLQILVIVLFTGIGITLVVYAWIIWKKGREDQDQNPVNLDGQKDSETEEREPRKD